MGLPHKVHGVGGRFIMPRRRGRNRGRRNRYRARHSRRPHQQQKRPGKLRRFLGGIVRNRRNPASRWVTFRDIGKNFQEWWYGFDQRVPRGATFEWKGGKIVSHQTRNNWPC